MVPSWPIIHSLTSLQRERVSASSSSMAATASKKKVSSSNPHIHDDIAFSILSKLPLKSLTRFTCANKSWSLLFENPNFLNMFRTNFLISKHHDDSETRLLIKEQSRFPLHQSLSIFSGERFKIRAKLDWPLPFQQDPNANADAPPIFILGSASVNGTLCLYQGLTTLLWNPITSEFKIIPHSLFNFTPQGFGYDCVTNDFKVIRKVTYPMEFEGKLYEPFWEIYSLKSDSWRKLDGFDDMPVSSPSTSMVNLNGFCHWFTEVHDNDIMSFDFSRQTFVATTLPSSDVKYRFNLVELNESLSVIYNYDRTPDFHIWVLGEVGVKESWTKLLVVGSYDCSIVCPVTAGNKNRVFFREEDSELGWLDLSTQRVERFEVQGESFCTHMVIYKENLLPFPRNE